MTGELTYPDVGHADCAGTDSVAFLREKGVEISAPIMIDQMEREHMTPVVVDGQSQVLPFGHSNKQWLALKAKWKPGDYFVRYRSSPELAKENKLYVDGHLLVRNGCVIGSIPGAIS